MIKSDFLKKELSRIIKGAISPAEFFSSVPRLWYLYAAIPAAAFLFFFLQIGLDRAYLGTASAGTVVLLCFLGVLSGAAFVFFESGAVRLMCRLLHTDVDFIKLNTAVCMTFVFTFLLNLIGLLCKLIFAMNTSVAFGLTGLLLSFVFLYEILFSLEIGGVKKRKISAVLGVTLIMTVGILLVGLIILI